MKLSLRLTILVLSFWNLYVSYCWIPPTHIQTTNPPLVAAAAASASALDDDHEKRLGDMVSNSCQSTQLPTFPNRIPVERLGKKHDSLESFYQHSFGTPVAPPKKKTKEYTLIVVTETIRDPQQDPPKQRILLGLKNRGFGTGKYNSFGGKFLPDTAETPAECACRELHEETNLSIPLATMEASKVGVQRFTFCDNDKEMLVHLYFLDLANEKQATYEIRECEEITPQWFDSFDDVPLDNMFADDSLWLTALLAKKAATSTNNAVGPPLVINGSYHFANNCEETNTILHYYMDVKDPVAAAAAAGR